MRVNIFLNIEGKRFWVGGLSEQGAIYFQYASSFLKTAFEVSPIAMPLSESVWKASNGLFDGLPGFVADSLPDGWGNLLLDRQLRAKGLRLHQISPLERLSWVGKSGMGALEYEPEKEEDGRNYHELHLDSISNEVNSILQEKESKEALALLSQLNGSSGGARPKIVCLVSDDFKRLARGTLAKKGFSPWLVKFRNHEDSKDAGVQEFVCSQIARLAGINVPQTHLFESTQDPGWFAIKRFDRTGMGGKIHMVTAAGLLHCDFRQPCLDYETLMTLTARLAGSSALLEMFKRAVLNYSISNCDDHAKNFSFLMDSQGRWSLSPAYDVVPSVSMSNEHMTSVLGIAKEPSRKTFLQLASKFDLTESMAIKALDEVAEAVETYTEQIRQYGVKLMSGVRPI